MPQHSRPPSNAKTISFVVILCLVSAVILAVVATSLRSLQVKAKELDSAKQMLIAAKIYNAGGYFEVLNDEEEFVPAVYDEDKEVLVPADEPESATEDQIYAVFRNRLRPYLTDADGNVESFEQANIDLQDYIDDNSESGYSGLPEKLFYIITPNNPPSDPYDKPYGYLIPVNGFGLWGPIFGYVAVEPNADTVIGISWYAPLETPGLGAIIQDASWQEQFEGKDIFQPPAEGEVNLETARLGITVVKGKVSDIFGTTPRAQTAVDGITGATLTGNGVTEAYKSSLEPYRALLVKANRAYEEDKPLIEGQ